MLSLSVELKNSRFALYRWPQIIWFHAYRDFKLYYEQDDELHYFVVKSTSQQLMARIFLVLFILIFAAFVTLTVHSVFSFSRFKNLEQEKIIAEQKRNEALSVLSQLSGENNPVSANASQEQLLQMAQEYKQRVHHLEQMVQFSAQELSRANRSLEMGLKAAGLKPADLNRMRVSLERTIVPSGGPSVSIESSPEQEKAYKAFKSSLQQSEELNRVIKAFPTHDPVRYAFVSSKFGARIHPITHQLSFHEGIDYIPTFDTNAYSTMNGRVMSVSHSKDGYGNMVMIEHPHGVKTLYGHLNKIYVKENQTINPGQVIGKIGNTGFSTGRHLHYEILVNESKLNPSIMTAMAKNVY
jgi:murein DD-endopeptidase MepM/ murein hydrolase activator NlpD